MTGDSLVPVSARLARRRDTMLGDLLPGSAQRFLDEPGALLTLPLVDHAGTLSALDDDGDWHLLGQASGVLRVPLGRPLRYANHPGWLHGETLVAIAAVRQLAALTLTGPAVDERVTAVVARCHQVQSLELRFTSLGRVEIAELARMPALRELELQGLPTDLDLQQISGLLRLRLLHGAEVVLLPDLDGLQELVLHDVPLESQQLGALPRLLSLDLSRTTVEDRMLDQLAESPLLEALNLSQTAITTAALPALGRIASLVNLDLRGTALTGNGIHALTALPRLRGLDLSLTAFEDLQLALLGELAQLRVLRLRSTDLSSATLAAIVSANPGLLVLDVSNCRIDDQVVPSLLGLVDLQHLGVAGTQLSRQGLATLHAANPALQFG